MSLSSKQAIGASGELFVANWLKQQGFTILESNYYYRGGEIDLIATKKELLVFVEVKLRATATFMADLVPLRKQLKIIKTAKKYLSQHDHSDKIWRFDIALVHNDTIEYLEHAFIEAER